MFKLSAFADEISPDLDEQIKGCRENDVTHFELRSVNKINVLDLDKDLRQTIKSKLGNAGMGVISIGSPIGKVKITDHWDKHFDRFKIAVEMAEFFEAPLIRIFSYYPPEPGGDISKHRDEVMKRMRAKVDYVQSHNVTLIHENEKDIYGDIWSRCVDLMQTIESPKFRFAFDFANFVQCGDKPLANWPALKPYSVHIHIKDAMLKDGKVVPAGQGDGQLEPILIDLHKSGYNEFLSLEPHLSAAGQYGGFSGPQLFKVAVDALKALCKKNNLPLDV
ncbi:MAG TPA: TIM barrel protein [Tepidisphaeraceae bacterium]|jgi:sugar phosphate isomerase/epimerase|nr:TIM barrel protein [Tepidisphaeraceae bacterium]